MQQEIEQERRAVVSAGEGLIPQYLIDTLAEGRAQDPFSILGPHMAGRRVQIRSWQPGALRVHVIGPEADGHPPQGAPLLLSVGYSDLQGHFKQPAGVSLGEIIRTMAPIVQNQLGRVCFIQETQYLPPDAPTLEVLFQNQKQEAIADHHVKRCTGSNISPHS